MAIYGNVAKKQSIKVRSATKSDYDDIINLLDSISDQDKKFLALSQKLSLIKKIIKSGNHCLVATINGNVVGFLRESGRPEGYSLLEEIVVSPEYRGYGIAQKLLDEYHSQYDKNLAKTNAANKAMIHLLKKNGYEAENPNAARIINWKRN